jgi:hypothetical protein
MSITAQQVLLALQGQRFTLHDEKELQRQIAKVLTEAGLPFTREVRLSPASIIDFMVGTVGVEVKIRASISAKSIYQQCERYCAFPEVAELLLVTNKSIGLPTDTGKPIHLLNLGTAWL